MPLMPSGGFRALGRLAQGALLLCAAGVLVACASGSDSQAKPTPLASIESPLAIQQGWDADVGRADGYFLRPCVVEHAVYAAGRNGTLARLDPVTGKEVWRVSVDGGISAGVGCDGLAVAVGGPRGTVSVFNPEGKLLWEVQATSDVLAAPLVGHELVLVHSTDQRIAAYDVANGKRRWVFQKQGPSLSLRAEANLVFFGDSVLAGFPGGRLGAISLTNGANRWEAAVSEPKGATEVERLADVIGVPAVAEGDVCTASYQGRIACFDAGNGDLRWAREFSAGAGVAVAGDTVIGIDVDSRIKGFKRSSGAVLWQNGALAFRALGTPVVVGNLVVVGDYQGLVHFLSLSDGRIVGRFDAGNALASAPQSWNNAALLQTARGRVMLISPAHG